MRRNGGTPQHGGASQASPPPIFLVCIHLPLRRVGAVTPTCPMQLMLASTCRGSRCRLGTLAEAHVIFGRQIPVAATASLQRQVSSASVHLEARPAPLNEPSTCHARGSAKGSSAATTSSVRCAPGWHQGSGSAAMAPAVTALTGTSRSFYR